jgi:glycosyltransferase involved in cell wall biosynthesis
MKLSIALATCNGQRYLRDQLDSFVSQTRSPDELVVCDDRSDDETPTLLEKFGEQSPFTVRIFHNEPRLGIIKNFERAVSLCRGDVIFLSDQDDSWASDKIARHEAVYLRHPELGLVFSNGDVVDEALAPLGYTLYDTFGVRPRRQRAINAGYALDQLVKSSRVTGCTLSFRADCRDILLPLSDQFLHDQWISLIMSAIARVRSLPESLIRYRRHHTQAVGATQPECFEIAQRPSWLPPRTVYIQRERERLTEALDRLSRFKPRLWRRDFREVIQGKLDHLQRRESLSRSLLSRLPRITWEVCSGNYLRYGQWPKRELIDDLRHR